MTKAPQASVTRSRTLHFSHLSKVCVCNTHVCTGHINCYVGNWQPSSAYNVIYANCKTEMLHFIWCTVSMSSDAPTLTLLRSRTAIVSDVLVRVSSINYHLTKRTNRTLYIIVVLGFDIGSTDMNLSFIDHRQQCCSANPTRYGVNILPFPAAVLCHCSVNRKRPGQIYICGVVHVTYILDRGEISCSIITIRLHTILPVVRESPVLNAHI